MIVLDSEHYEQLVRRAGAPRVRPIIDTLLARSVERRRSLYEALAK